MASLKFAQTWIDNNAQKTNGHTLLNALASDYLEALARTNTTKEYRKHCNQQLTNIKNMLITFYKLNYLPA